MTEAAVETYDTTTRGAASMAAYRAVRILQLLSENTGEDKAMLSDELIRRLAHPDDPARMPISAARRSIYTAISALRHAGYEIEYKRGVGYKLLTRPLTDEEIIRLHGMVMRNRSTPIAIRKSMAQHLVAMASADVRGYLDTPEPAPSAGSKATKATRTPIKRIDTCELVEQAIDHGTTVSFDISSVTTRGETEAARMTLRPFAIRQRDGISYLLGTVYDARGTDDTLRTVEIAEGCTHLGYRAFDYPYRPSDSVLKNPPGCCKNGHQRYYSSTCTLSQCSVSSHFYTGGNDMKDITISRRSLLVSAGLLALAPLAGCGGNSGSGSAAAGSDYTIGVLQLTEHSALDAANDGFVKAIKESDLKVKIDQKNAQNDQSTCKSIADKFVGDGVDLIYAIATPAAQAAAGATADIPIVGCAITDYAASGLVQDNDKPGTNVTGASDLTPVAEQLEMMQKVLPDVKKVGLLYCTAESNSDVQIKAAKKELDKLGLEYTDFTVSSSNEIQSVVESAVGKVDALYSPTDNTIAAGASQVGQICKENKLPFVTGEEGMCKAGGLFTLSINYEDLGYAAGEMAVKILKGEAKPEDMPIKHLSSKDLVVVKNDEMAEALGIDLSALDA